MKRLPSLFLCLFIFACGGMEEGPRGPQGPQGPPGDDGAGLVSSWTCTGTATVAGQQVAFNSARHDFADGSVLATCLVNDRSASYSGTFLWKQAAPGAGNGTCLVVYDMDTPSEGYWNFATFKGTSGYATYVDPNSSLNGHKANLICTQR